MLGLLIIYTFFIIFGMKIGYLDLSVFVPLVILPFLMLNKKIYIPVWVIYVMIGIILLNIILLFSQISNNNFNFDDNLRLLRAVLVVPIIIFVFNNISTNNILNIVFYSILLHCLLIIIAANHDGINAIFSVVSGNDKVALGRSSGLLAGFDIAGFLSLIAISMLIFDLVSFPPILRIIFFIFIFISISYTSRVSMIVALLLSFVFGIRLIFYNRYGILLKILLSLLALCFVTYYSVNYIKILDVTFNVGLFDISQEELTDIARIHAVQQEGSFLWADMFILPDTLGEIIFGNGADQILSDVGYVKEIFRYGVVGLFTSILVHYYIIISVVRSSRYRSGGGKYFNFSVILLILILLLNFKNNYFFTRGVWPFYIIYALAASRWQKLPPPREKNHIPLADATELLL